MNSSRQPTEDEIRAELERVISSTSFEQADRHRRFLSFVVEESLAGRGDRLKGYAIAISVFDKPDDFDPQADPLVRVEAGRLRKRLAQYYADEGSGDPLHISIPRGTYQARFNVLERNAGPQRVAAPRKSRHGTVFLATLAGLAGAAVALLVVLALQQLQSQGPDAAARDSDELTAILPDWPRVFIAAFTDISDFEDYSNFAYGISEEISLRIADFELLIIAERPVAAAERELVEPVPLRRELDADYLLTGTVRSDGQLTRITVRLAETDTGTMIWSQVYDAEPSADSMLEIEKSIARQIVNAVAMPYGPIYERELARRSNRPLAEATTYDCLLKFHEYRQEIDRTLRADARNCFQSVLDKGQGVAETIAGLAIVEMDEYVYGPEVYSESEERLEMAGELARRALDLDGDSYLAHLAMMRARFHSGDVDGAWESADRVVRLGRDNPIGVPVVSTYRLLVGLPAVGDLEPARVAALSADPRGHYFVPLTLEALRNEDYEAALGFALRIDTPNWFGGPMIEAATAALAGRPGIAERSLAQMMEIGPTSEQQVHLFLERFNTETSLRETLLRGLREAGLPSD